MTYTDDVRSQLYVASVFEGFEGADRVGRSFAQANVGVETVGDLLRLTLPQIRHLMDKAHLPEGDQNLFLNQMRASRLYPRGIANQQQFKLG